MECPSIKKLHWIQFSVTWETQVSISLQSFDLNICVLFDFFCLLICIIHFTILIFWSFSLKLICPYFSWYFFCSEIYYIVVIKAYILQWESACNCFGLYIFVNCKNDIVIIMANKWIWIKTSSNLDWHIVIPA